MPIFKKHWNDGEDRGNSPKIYFRLVWLVNYGIICLDGCLMMFMVGGLQIA